MQTTELRRYKHLINGEWVDSDPGQTITRNNPATGQPVSEFAAGSQEDTWRAIDAARAAFDRGPWPGMTGAERGQFLYRLTQRMREEAEQLAHIEVQEVGKTIRFARRFFTLDPQLH